MFRRAYAYRSMLHTRLVGTADQPPRVNGGARAALAYPTPALAAVLRDAHKGALLKDEVCSMMSLYPRPAD
jgi:hypothetical protein